MRMLSVTRWRAPVLGVAIALSCALVLFALSTMGASAAKAIIITKRTDQSSPELFSNFAPTASLAADGQTAHVAGTVDCAGPTAAAVPVEIWVMVWQRGGVATGTARAQCTGAVESWSVDVAAHDARVLTAGAAQAHAWVGVAPEAGGGPSAFDWGRAIVLTP